MTAEPQTILERCKANGRRITGPRRIIAKVIASAKDHPDAQEIHRRVAGIDPGVSLSTVYRTLRVFADSGLIEQHSFDGRRLRIEGAAAAHHDHLIDADTGKVIEFRSEEIERLQTELARKLGYELTGHRLELYGRPLRQS